jgi:hypothetical protein
MPYPDQQRSRAQMHFTTVAPAKLYDLQDTARAITLHGLQLSLERQAVPYIAPRAGLVVIRVRPPARMVLPENRRAAYISM